MSIRPLHDHVVVKRLDTETKTAGGIVIPDHAKEKPMSAEVIAVGSGKPLDNGEIRVLSVKPGDRVLIGKYAGSDVKSGGEELVVLREDDILAVVNV